MYWTVRYTGTVRHIEYRTVVVAGVFVVLVGGLKSTGLSDFCLKIIGDSTLDAHTRRVRHYEFAPSYCMQPEAD